MPCTSYMFGEISYCSDHILRIVQLTFGGACVPC